MYAENGPDVDRFTRLVEAFNERAREPTAWKLRVYRGADYLDTLRSERRGDVVIIAGKNDAKMGSIRALHDDGLFVLGDKPLLIDAGQLPLLRHAAGTPPLAMDIMTERHEVATRVQRSLIAQPEIFGDYRIQRTEPALHFKSVHHLHKLVNGHPLIRPHWYFDTEVQGEGITDVTTHLVDLAQWMTGGNQPFDYERDVELLSARQWPTWVPRDIIARITGLDDVPQALNERIEANGLPFLCNASISCRLRGVPVQIDSQWNISIPQGGGDTHYAIARGSTADLTVEHGPETGYTPRLTVRPLADGAGFVDALVAATNALRKRYPGLGFERDAGGYHMTIPDMLRTSHEARFATVLDEFLGYIDSGNWPANLGPDLVTKYTLLAHARDLSHRNR